MELLDAHFKGGLNEGGGMNASGKKEKGQFYTTHSSYILEGFSLPSQSVRCILEPFAGKGDLLDWAKKKGWKGPIQAYDIEPKKEGTHQQDTLLEPPNYEQAWILTNPPFLARNKSQNKKIYDLYKINDLYKCFIRSVAQQNNCIGGLFIIPAGFFFSARHVDAQLRNEFLSNFKITKIKYFEETVFEDTTTTIVAFSFEKSMEPLSEQVVEWWKLPSNERKLFRMDSKFKWIVGGELYHLPIEPTIKIRRTVRGQALQENEQQTFMTLNALDSGTPDKRISLLYHKGYIYDASESSRSFATLRILGKTLSEEEQIQICNAFNEFVEQKREETWSLCLPQFRESKEYARKRIPFELAYQIVNYLLTRKI